MQKIKQKKITNIPVKLNRSILNVRYNTVLDGAIFRCHQTSPLTREQYHNIGKYVRWIELNPGEIVYKKNIRRSIGGYHVSFWCVFPEHRPCYFTPAKYVAADVIRVGCNSISKEEFIGLGKKLGWVY